MEELLAERGGEVDHVTVFQWCNASLHWDRPRHGHRGRLLGIAGAGHHAHTSQKAITDVDPKNRLSAVFTELTRAI